MAKVTYPLLSKDASGKIGKGVVYRKGGIVSRSFKPRNPNSAAQQAQREFFKEVLVGAHMNHGNLKNLDKDDHPQYFNQARGDARYLQEVPQQTHGGLSGLANDDHTQYLTQTRGDARYIQSVPQQDHGGLSGLGDDDHAQYLTQARGDARYIQGSSGSYIPVDGWVVDSNTWTYASALTFTISGDHTAIFRKGTRLKLTQTTVKYFNCLGSTYAAPNTTVTITGGNDFTLANAAISAQAYSCVLLPAGWPIWFAFTCTWVTFSAAPSGTSGKFRVDENVCTLHVIGNYGTSNGTSLTLVLPVTAAQYSTSGSWTAAARGRNNSADLTTPVLCRILEGANYLYCYTTWSLGVWTNSGTKGIYGVNIAYEI